MLDLVPQMTTKHCENMGNENKNTIARNNRYFTCMEVLQTTLKKESNKHAALLLKLIDCS